MRIAVANLFCLNPRPTRAVAAVAAQQPDVAAVIESTRRFDSRAATRLPPRRDVAVTRKGGLPIALYVREDLPVERVRASGRGWVEWRVGEVHLLVVHAIAPYLPWRWRRRERQLLALARRLRALHERRPETAALALGDFNTARFEPTWRRMERELGLWRRLELDCSPCKVSPGRVAPNGVAAGKGTWPWSCLWAPIALDHVVAAPAIAEQSEALRARAFPIPGSDHRGVVVDLPVPDRRSV
ncbi:MAG: endonuclease/exonuclease/phosphatase family protein [Planctomycetota bacterium]|nr:MAG: endonuclease/exonuclease/phosphatase family protein [Planctomycetota bacterium]